MSKFFYGPIFDIKKWVPVHMDCIIFYSSSCLYELFRSRFFLALPSDGDCNKLDSVLCISHIWVFMGCKEEGTGYPDKLEEAEQFKLTSLRIE